tara:strand:- start:1737 stop:2402 length:666 start_codon:yes stop_codon:yes gene_type:complete
MATSSSRDFDLDVAEIIEEAYERCGLESRTGYDLKTARRSLNIMFAEWANRGLNLWTVEQATQALTSGTASYSLTTDYTDLLEVVVRRSSTDFAMTKMSRGDYLNIPTKSQTGRPTQYYFDRRTTPSLTLWPTPENSTDSLVYYYVRRIQDVDTQINTTDAPFRFLPCVIAGLSYYLSVKKAPNRVQLLKSIYEEEFQRASDEDDDRVPLKLTPDIKYLRV